MKRGKKHSDKSVEYVSNSLLDLKLHVAYRHIFPEEFIFSFLSPPPHYSSLCVNLSDSHVDRGGEKSIKVSGDNCFPHRSLVSFLHYLCCFAFHLFMCWSCFAPPHFLLHRLCFLFGSLSHIIGLQAIPTALQRSLLILFSHKQQTPCFEITKSGSCRIHLLYPAQKCFNKRQKVLRGLQGWDEGRWALAHRHNATFRLLKSTEELKPILSYCPTPNPSQP